MEFHDRPVGAFGSGDGSLVGVWDCGFLAARKFGCVSADCDIYGFIFVNSVPEVETEGLHPVQVESL